MPLYIVLNLIYYNIIPLFIWHVHINAYYAIKECKGGCFLETINISLGENNSELELEKLKGLLLKLNAEVEVSEGRLLISYEKEDLNRVTTRHAGRKPVTSKTFCTLGDVEKMLLTMSGREVAKELGISKSLFYAKLKALREAGSSSTTLFE
jgi:hypothetical protein